MNLSIGSVTIKYSTAEIVAVNEGSIDFRLTQAEDVIAFGGGTKILPSDDYKVEKYDEMTLVKSKKHAKVNDQLRVLVG
jgi:beta-galactosidase